MSGGVDSSVAAYMLQRQGYRVIGVFMVNVERGTLPGSACAWEHDYAAARAAADHLGIPLYTWNFARQYRQLVLRDFFAQYRAGRTPNPDVWCNEKIKFGLFLQQAIRVGADYAATGHYARVGRSQGSETRLYRGVDPSKDQSYFLYRSTQKTLARTLFPLGGMAKAEVRALARQIRLPNADRPDSQGICFIGEVKIADFLQRSIHPRAGKIVDGRGRALGQHRGAWLYTVGQRGGLGLAGGPWYVVATDVRKNLVRVTANPRDPALFRRSFKLGDVSWVSGSAPTGELRCTVEVRYHQQRPRRGTVRRSGRSWQVELDQPERAVTPGQHAVLYAGARVLGGGVIRW